MGLLLSFLYNPSFDFCLVAAWSAVSHSGPVEFLPLVQILLAAVAREFDNMLLVHCLILISNIPAFFYGIAKNSSAFVTSTTIFICFSYLSVQAEWNNAENWKELEDSGVLEEMDGWSLVGVNSTLFSVAALAMPRLYTYFGWLLPGLLLFFVLLIL